MFKKIRPHGDFVPTAPSLKASHEKWNHFFGDYVNLLTRHYNKVEKRDRRFTVIPPNDAWKIAEYWYDLKPGWIKVLSKRYPADAFEGLWSKEITRLSPGQQRQFWMMFLSFGFQPRPGPTGEEIQTSRVKFPKVMPKGTPFMPHIRHFRYPIGILNPAHTEDIKYIWRAIDLAIHINRYRQHRRKRLGPLGGILAYRTGVDVAADYNAMLPEVLFTSDMPGMPGELSMLFSPSVHMEQRPREEAQLDEDLTQKAIDRAMAVEREGAKKAIQEYEKSIEEMKRQLDQQNNELRMAQVSVGELTAKVSGLANKLKECQDEAKERGEAQTETELEETRTQLVKVYSDITSLSSTLGRVKDDNEDAIEAAEGVDDRAANAYQGGRKDLLAQIHQGIKLKPTTAKEKREHADDTSIAAILKRRLEQQRAAVAISPTRTPAMTPRYTEWENMFEGAGESMARYYRLGNVTRPIQYVSPDISYLNHLWH